MSGCYNCGISGLSVPPKKRLWLPTVTLMIIDCIDLNRTVKVIEHCKKEIDFGAVKILSSLPYAYCPALVEIPRLNSLIEYSIFMLTKVHQYIDTKHVLIVQRDGFILNPGKWNNEWLEYDYIGPLFVQYDKVGSGGFSLRSRELMKFVATHMPEWDGTLQDAHRIQSDLGYYEDGVICLSNKFKKFDIALPDQSAEFAHGGNRNPKYFREQPFGFHRTFADIDFKTGKLKYDLSKDLKNSYHDEIDGL